MRIILALVVSLCVGCNKNDKPQFVITTQRELDRRSGRQAIKNLNPNFTPAEVDRIQSEWDKAN